MSYGIRVTDEQEGCFEKVTHNNNKANKQTEQILTVVPAACGHVKLH